VDYDLRVAILDSFRFKGGYSWDLARQLSKSLGEDLLLYAPKRVKNECGDCQCVFRNAWSPLLYPLQVAKQGANDRISILHVQFEFHKFGSPYASFLIVPLLFLVRTLGIKIVVTIHGPLFPRNASNRTFDFIPTNGLRVPAILLKAYASLVYKMISALSDALIVHANIFRKWLNQFGVSNCYVVPHGTKVLESIQTEESSKESIRILYFGVVSPRKGIEYLLESFASLKLPHTKLIIAGFEPRYYQGYTDKLRGIIQTLGIGKQVTITGYVPEKDIPQLFREATIMVLPYNYSISASGPLMLALSYGTPTIVTRTKYFSEMFGNSNDVLLVPPEDPKSLSRAILKLLTNSELRIRISSYLRLESQRYSWEKVAKSTFEIYQTLLSKK